MFYLHINRLTFFAILVLFLQSNDSNTDIRIFKINRIYMTLTKGVKKNVSMVCYHNLVNSTLKTYDLLSSQPTNR